MLGSAYMRGRIQSS